MLIVDDSPVFRKVLRGLVKQDPAVAVVGEAGDGRAALDAIRLHEPHLITLDLEMPVMDGFATLRELESWPSPPRVLVITADSTDQARATVRALAEGATDYIVKPFGGNGDPREAFGRALAERIRILTGSCGAPEAPAAAAPLPRLRQPVSAIGIAVSTGGPRSLQRVLPALPADLPVPVFLVQHMPPTFTSSLAQLLDARCAVRVTEAADGQPVRPGTVYVAPGDRQLGLVAEGGGIRTTLTDDPHENSCRPAADYTFRALARVYGSGVVAVVMTGMGVDGRSGCDRLKRRRATVLTQDEASSVVYGMPKHVDDAGLSDARLPLDEIGPSILALTMEHRR